MSADRECERTVRTKDGQDHEVTICYRIEGRGRPATRLDPAEYPDLIIDGITAAQEDGSSRMLGEEDFSDEAWDGIIEQAWNDYEDSRYNPAWDGPDED